MKTIESHAWNYQKLLSTRWKETQWSELEREQVFSLNEDDIYVLVRDKSDAEVEFGNGLYLAE